ncbi:MAG: MFS transporter [Verrucomicrobia bacterium]|nr:MFS transporter [Verrucomicrobiota bacterium]
MSTAPQHHALTKGREITTLLALGAVQFTHVLDFMIMMPLGPQLMRVFAITPEQFTHLVATYAFAAAGSGFIGGFFMDRFDRKRALLITYAGFAFATVACAFAPTHHWLLAARFAAGAFGGLAGSLVNAMVADVIPPERRGRANSVVMAAFPVASVLGIWFSLFLTGLFGWHAPFFLVAGCAAVNLVVSSLALPHLPTAVRDHEPIRQMREILTHSIHRKALAVGAVLIMGGGALIPFLASSMVANMGLNESQIALPYAVGGICTFFSMPIIGWLSDHMNRFTLLAWLSLGASVVALVITRLGLSSITFICTMMAFFMVTMSGRFAPAMTMVTNAVEGRYRGGFMAVNSALQQAASGLANLIAGWFVTSDATGHLNGYPIIGYISVAFFGLTVLLAAELRNAAPHVAVPAKTRILSSVPAKAAA